MNVLTSKEDPNRIRALQILMSEYGENHVIRILLVNNNVVFSREKIFDGVWVKRPGKVRKRNFYCLSVSLIHVESTLDKREDIRSRSEQTNIPVRRGLVHFDRADFSRLRHWQAAQ